MYHTHIVNTPIRKFASFIVFTSLVAFFFLPFGGATGGICQETDQTPDYSNSSSWVHKSSQASKPVDIFYVYPTIYSEESPPNMDISDKELRHTAVNLLSSQAGVYSDSANLFAPYYRQMSMARLRHGEDMYENKFFKIGYSDVLRAFQYFLVNLNNNRPFIIAGHSQGSMTLINLMRDTFNEQDLQKRLVAAYLIGYSVTDQDLKNFPWMQPATGATDTGVIISYNTQAPGTTTSPVLLAGAICINPLNWKTDATVGDKSLNRGAVFFNHATGKVDREIPHYAGAVIDNKTGALTTVPPEPLDIGAFPKGVYHMYDYALWYNNLKENVKIRIKSYLERAEK